MRSLPSLVKLIQTGKFGAGSAADAALFSESLPIYSGVARIGIAGGQREISV